VDKAADEGLMARIPRPDSVLLQQTAAGDRRAWEELRSRHALPLYAHVFALVGESSAAEQVVAETFAHAWCTAGQFDLSAEVNATAWLAGLARDLLLARPTATPPASSRAG
jgi:DNA-directed RNA polymerase specialized sigma24 family protein